MESFGLIRNARKSKRRRIQEVTALGKGKTTCNLIKIRNFQVIHPLFAAKSHLSFEFTATNSVEKVIPAIFWLGRRRRVGRQRRGMELRRPGKTQSEKRNRLQHVQPEQAGRLGAAEAQENHGPGVPEAAGQAHRPRLRLRQAHGVPEGGGGRRLLG